MASNSNPSTEPSTSSTHFERAKFIPKQLSPPNWRLRYLYGSDHPSNRFMFRLRKMQGTLPEELLHKEEVLDDYFKTRVFDAPTDAPRLTYGV